VESTDKEMKNRSTESTEIGYYWKNSAKDAGVHKQLNNLYL
jgi:hypothetical protein